VEGGEVAVVAEAVGGGEGEGGGDVGDVGGGARGGGEGEEVVDAFGLDVGGAGRLVGGGVAAAGVVEAGLEVWG
jgi:hypothetical protein